MEERLSLRELTHLYERLSREQRDDLLPCMLISASRGGEAMVKVLEDELLCHATEELLEGHGESNRGLVGGGLPSAT
jgi:hypothetical protein